MLPKITPKAIKYKMIPIILLEFIKYPGIINIIPLLNSNPKTAAKVDAITFWSTLIIDPIIFTANNNIIKKNIGGTFL